MSYISLHNYTDKQILSPIKLLLSFLLLTSLFGSSLFSSAVANATTDNYNNIISSSTGTKKVAKVATTLSNGARAVDLHPNVWGYDLSDNKLIPKSYSSRSLYKAPDGDLLIEFSRCFKNCNQSGEEKYEYAIFWFFAGKVEFLKDLKSMVAYKKKHLLSSHDFGLDRAAKLSNGNCIKTINVSTAKLCQINDLAENVLLKGKCETLNEFENISDYNIITNQNSEIERYTIIIAKDNVDRYVANDEYGSYNCPNGAEIIYQQLFPVISVFGVDDGTFIALQGNLIIRFDSNFKTKFIAKRDIKLTDNKIIKGNFFVLPYEKIEQLSNKIIINNNHAIQGLQNELLIYLYKRQENK